eukprot:sb/3477444/
MISEETDPAKQIVTLLVHNIPVNTNRVTLKTFFKVKTNDLATIDSVNIDQLGPEAEKWRALIALCSNIMLNFPAQCPVKPKRREIMATLAVPASGTQNPDDLYIAQTV